MSIIAELPLEVIYYNAGLSALTLLVTVVIAYKSYRLQQATQSLQESDRTIKNATYELQKDTLALQQSTSEIKVEIDKSTRLINENNLALDISRHARDLKKETFFALVGEWEQMLLVCARLYTFPPEKYAEIITQPNLAVKLMQTHLVASPELADACLSFGFWMMQALPSLAQDAIKVNECQQKIDHKKASLAAYNHALGRYLEASVNIVGESRTRMLPIMREMRKELGIDGAGDWEKVEKVWRAHLSTLNQRTSQLLQSHQRQAEAYEREAE